MRALKALLLCLTLTGAATVVPLPATAGGGLFVPVTITGSRAPHGAGQYHDDVLGQFPAAEDLFFHTADVLITGTGEPAQNLTVRLERRLGDGPWSVVDGTPVTGPDGVATAFQALRGTSKYRWVFDGDETYAPATSNVVRIKAMRDFNTTATDLGDRVELGGDINPGWGGRTVTLQRRSCDGCPWTDVRAARASDSGAWRFRVSRPANGTWDYRAAIPAAGLFVRSTSAVVGVPAPVG